MGKYVDFYCNDNNRELKNLVNPIITKKFGWLPQKDYDDIYSIASMVVWDCEQKFNSQKGKSRKFKNFLSTCIHNKIKTYITYLNRDKRKSKDEDDNPIYDLSIDAPFGEEESLTIGDMITNNSTIEKEFFEEKEEGYSKEMCKYLSRLSALQKEVLRLISIGFMPNEVIEELHINQKIYEDCYEAIRSYRNISILL